MKVGPRSKDKSSFDCQQGTSISIQQFKETDFNL